MIDGWRRKGELESAGSETRSEGHARKECKTRKRRGKKSEKKWRRWLRGNSDSLRENKPAQ